MRLWSMLSALHPWSASLPSLFFAFRRVRNSRDRGARGADQEVAVAVASSASAAGYSGAGASAPCWRLTKALLIGHYALPVNTSEIRVTPRVNGSQRVEGGVGCQT
jgi:hypothetical protein